MSVKVRRKHLWSVDTVFIMLWFGLYWVYGEEYTFHKRDFIKCGGTESGVNVGEVARLREVR